MKADKLETAIMPAENLVRLHNFYLFSFISKLFLAIKTDMTDTIISLLS